jgi:1,4-dihydroxy-6-naphthoate synthase
MAKRLTLGYSPCPNDCFIFDALVNGRLDTGDLQFDVLLEDVETLNKWALAGKLDITKLSYHAYTKVVPTYILMRAGSALGFNCGPLLIANKPYADPANEIKTVAIPGELTTANFLLSLAFPTLRNKVPMLFSNIEQAVLDGEVDAGLIIHENRFTYQEKGLVKVMDLGEYWDAHYHAPIPLGGIVMKRSHGSPLISQVNQLLRKSVEMAFENPEATMPYVREHAQAMRDEVMKQHIALYVNNYSMDIGHEGTAAIKGMFEQARALGLMEDWKHELIQNG